MAPCDNKRLPARCVVSVAPVGTPVFTEFHNSVAGVTFSNPDGRSRQDIIQRSVHAGMPPTLVLENDNLQDQYAVALFTPAGHQIGYLNRRTAADVRDHINEGRYLQITVSATTGGAPDWPTRGVNILVKVLAVPADLPMRKADSRKSVAAAKREGRYKEVQAWLLDDIEEHKKIHGDIIAGVLVWSYEQLANLFRKQKRWSDEVDIPKRYMSLPETRRMIVTDRLQRVLDTAIGRLKEGQS